MEALAARQVIKSSKGLQAVLFKYSHPKFHASTLQNCALTYSLLRSWVFCCLGTEMVLLQTLTFMNSSQAYMSC